MNDRRVLPFVLAMKRPDPARVAEFAETGRRLKQERAVSVDIVTSVLRETPRAAWPQLSERRELQNSGSLGQLAQEIEKRLDTDPREALALAELAVAIANELPQEEYPDVHLAQLRAHAWRDRGQAFSYLGRYDEALRDMDRAEEQLNIIGSLAHDQAALNLCRAVVFQHLRRFDEAHALLDECRQTFRGYADTQAYVKCTLAIGNLLVRKGDYRGAKEMLTPLVGSGDALREATIRCTLGWCAIQLDDCEEGLSHFRAVASRVAESPVHVARAFYGTGSALLRLSDGDGAVQHLQSARRTFLDHDLIEEAGLCGLEIVEAHLLQGDRREAQTLSSQIVKEFTDAHLSRRAITALAYLQDAVGTTSVTPETARNVHNYIVTLRTDPDCEFTAIN